MKNSPRTEWAAFALALALTSPLIIWSLDRRNPVDLLDYKVFPTTVTPGETLYRNITVRRHRICHTDADVSVVDSQKVRWYILEPPIVTPGPLGEESYKIAMEIPKAIAPGVAELRVTLTRKCNPMHEFWPLVEIMQPMRFTVSSPVDKQQAR